MSKELFPNSEFIVLDKFGSNNDVDGVEDVWTGGGDYPFPSTAATTTIVSSSSEDTLTTGTGAWTATISGVDANYTYTEETANMNGLTVVTLSTEFLRVFRIKINGVGTNGKNVGIIDVKHGATVLASVPAEVGQTQMAIYTLADDYPTGMINVVELEIIANNNQDIDYALIVRPNGTESWQTRDYGTVKASSDQPYQKNVYVTLEARDDVWLRVTRASTTNMIVTGRFLGVLMKTDVPSGTF